MPRINLVNPEDHMNDWILLVMMLVDPKLKSLDDAMIGRDTTQAAILLLPPPSLGNRKSIEVPLIPCNKAENHSWYNA